MPNLKCKMCGGTLEFQPGQSVAVCEYCGTMQTLPRLDSERIAGLYERAELLRRSNDFDKAAAVYDQIVSASPADAEAYWSLVLCRYGIEYVEDPATRKRIPTINRIQYGSVLDDADYLSALLHADAEQKRVYEAEAHAIEAIQKGFLAISMKEKPFDVFVCYKETDANGRRTPDSVLANDLYHQLTQEGFKVFFSRITLEDKLGAEYEPYIFAALNSSRVMVAMGTKAEYFNAPWVRNEWSRFLTLIKNGEQKTLIPAYRDMNPYDLPEEFSQLQALDMSRLGFVQDLVRGIKKLLGTEATVQTGTSAGVSPLLRRAFLFLEDGDWKSADEYCEKVLDRDPENGRAYLGKLMAAMELRTEAELERLEKPFDQHPLYAKAIRFGDSAQIVALEQYNQNIRSRAEAARLEAERQARERKEQARKAAEAEKQRQAAIRQARKEKRAAAKGKQPKWLLPVVAVVLLIAAGIFGVQKWQEVQQAKAEEEARLAALQAEKEAKAAEAARLAALEADYAAAMELLDAKAFEEAIAAFTELQDFRDSEAKLAVAEIGLKMQDDYNAAAAAMAAGKYTEAMVIWKQLGDHLDCPAQYAICGVEQAWQAFRGCIDGVETVDYAAASAHLDAMMDYEIDLAAERRDDGYFELAQLAYTTDLGQTSVQCLEQLANPDRFANFDDLKENADLLYLYQQAEAITLTDWNSRTQLQELIDQLPEEYRDVAGLKKKIVDYDAAVAEAEEKRKKEAELEEWNKKLIGTWVSSDGFWTLTMNADGTYTEKENGVVVRYGTYGVGYIFPEGYEHLGSIQVWYTVPKEFTEKTGVRWITHNLGNITETSFTMTGHNTTYFIRK